MCTDYKLILVKVIDVNMNAKKIQKEIVKLTEITRRYKNYHRLLEFCWQTHDCLSKKQKHMIQQRPAFYFRNRLANMS